MPHITLSSGRIEYRMSLGDALRGPTIVLLHEGLGCVALWRDFPDKLAKRLGVPVIAYSRFGYGQSDGLLASRTPRFMHDEALLVLPELLDTLGIDRPLLIGHSDGASIALIHAAARLRPVSGVVAMAPHVLVEPVTLESIAEIVETFETTDLRHRLAEYHADAEAAFLGWSRIWLSPAFRTWNLGVELQSLEVATLLIQGEGDEYGTLAQIDAITDVAPTRPIRLILEDCRHSPHRDQPKAVLDAIEAFASSLS